MPHGIKAGGKAADGVEESVGRPDAEHGSLLTQRLAAAHGFPIVPANNEPRPKLEYARQKACKGQAREKCPTAVSVHRALGADGYSQTEGKCPKIESEVVSGYHTAMEARKHIAHKQGGKEGADEHGEHAAHNNPEAVNEAEALLRMHQGNDGRNEQSGQYVDEYGIGYYALHAAAQLLGNDGRRGCRRADEAHHGALQHGSLKPFSHTCLHGNEGQQTKKPALNEQEPKVPQMRAEVGRLYFAEGHKEHTEKEGRLHESYNIQRQGFVGGKERDGRINEIGHYPRQYGNGQCPILEKCNEAMHNSKWGSPY